MCNCDWLTSGKYNKDLKETKYSEEAGIVLLRPVYKKEDRNRIKHYIPDSMLNEFSKVCEGFFYNNLTIFTENIFSLYILTDGKHHSCNYVLLRQIKVWKKIKWQWLYRYYSYEFI